MKKVLPVPIVTVLFGAAGYLLRLWQRKTAFEEPGLLRPGMPATWCLVGMLAAACVVLILLSRRCVGEYENGYLGAFALTRSWCGVFYLVSGAFLVMAGFLGIRAGGGTVLRRLLSFLFLPTGVCVAWTAWLGTRKEQAKGRFNWTLVIPGYCGCLWLVTAYQGHTANPTVMEYAFLFLGIAAAILASYSIASFAFEKPHPRSALWFCAMGFILLAVVLADKATLPGDYVGSYMFLRYSWAPEGFAAVGYMIYLMTQMIVMLCRGVWPEELTPWTPADGREESKTGDEIDG